MDEQKPPESDVEYENEFSDPDDDADQVSRMDYIRSVVPPPKPKKVWPRVVSVIVLICALAAGIYVLAPHIHFDHQKTGKHSSGTAETKTSSTGVSPSQTTAYVSNGNDLNLTFDYPKNWSVSPPSDENPADQPITVKSPPTSLQLGGKQQTIQAVVQIRPGSSDLSELGAGTSTAAVSSTQFNYSQPTPTQDKFPYLTYISLTGGADSTGSFEEVVVSGSQQLQQGASITPTTIIVDPIITASFYACSSNSCQSESPLAITSGEWQRDGVFTQVMQLIESLEFN